MTTANSRRAAEVEAVGPPSRQTRRRPGPAEWAQIMTALMAEQATHGSLPLHVLEAVAARHGLAPRSVETRYAEHVAGLAASSPWLLGPAERASVAAASDFAEAYARLPEAGRPAFPVVERALWMDVSRALVGLRVAERRRRQAASEAGACGYCGAGNVLQAAA